MNSCFYQYVHRLLSEDYKDSVCMPVRFFPNHRVSSLSEPEMASLVDSRCCLLVTMAGMAKIAGNFKIKLCNNVSIGNVSAATKTFQSMQDKALC